MEVGFRGLNNENRVLGPVILQLQGIIKAPTLGFRALGGLVFTEDLEIRELV